MNRTELETRHGWVREPETAGYYVAALAPDGSLEIVQWPNEKERKVLLWLPLPKTYKV